MGSPVPLCDWDQGPPKEIPTVPDIADDDGSNACGIGVRASPPTRTTRRAVVAGSLTVSTSFKDTLIKKKKNRLAVISDQALTLPLDDQRRMAYLARYGDLCVRQLILGTAHHDAPFLSEEFQIAVQHSFGVPLKCLESYEGVRIRNHPNCPQLDVDKWGNTLQTVQGAKGDDTRTLHDAFVAAVAYSLRSAQIKFRGGGNGNRSCAHIFSDLLFLCTGNSEKERLLNGIIADLSVDLSDAGSSDFLDGDMPTTLFDQVQTLLDAKTLACGGTYKGLIPEGDLDSPATRAKFPAEVRAAKVTKDYYKVARKLDQKYHGTQPGTIGPIEARLREYGKPDEHAVSGLVLGAFGELSTDCYSLAYAIARVKAIKYLSYFNIKPQDALALHKQAVLRLWGLTAQRGWARLILNRLRSLVMLAEPPDAPEGDPDADAHDLHNFFFPDHGASAASAAGFGWRGGDGHV